MPDNPRIETPVGAVNGVNTIFTTLFKYQPGTPRVWLNGTLQRIDLDDGWTELGGKKIELNEAPEAGDEVQIYYIPIIV